GPLDAGRYCHRSSVSGLIRRTNCSGTLHGVKYRGLPRSFYSSSLARPNVLAYRCPKNRPSQLLNLDKYSRSLAPPCAPEPGGAYPIEPGYIFAMDVG